MEKITIKEVSRKEFNGAKGPYTKVFVKDAAGRDLSAFEGAWNKNWQNGQEVEVNVEATAGKDKNGNSVTYLNIKAPAGDHGSKPRDNSSVGYMAAAAMIYAVNKGEDVSDEYITKITKLADRLKSVSDFKEEGKTIGTGYMPKEEAVVELDPQPESDMPF